MRWPRSVPHMDCGPRNCETTAFLGCVLMTARRVGPAGAAVLLAVAGIAAQPRATRATDWDASIDMRLVAADAPTSFIDGGLGILRYGD